MKRFIKLLLCFTTIFNIFSYALISVNAATTYTVKITDTEGVNVRDAATTSSNVIGVLSYNSSAILVNTTKHSGTGCSGGWYQINYGGSTSRYICSDLVSSVSTTSTGGTTTGSTPTATSNYYTTSKWTSRINENYATVKSSPSFDASGSERIFLGTEVSILSGPTSATSNCSTGWYKINYYNGKTGYVCARLVDKYNEVTATDANYNKTLQAAGFPESYWPYLTYLHQKHPNWVFKAQNTNLSFNDAINGELGKNYLQYSSSGLVIPAYVTSSTPVESGTWYVANSSVVAFFLDPRNYLNEKNIFSFETLSYDSSTQTSNIVKSVFGSSYLSSDTYVNYFMNAGSTYNISPVHLATRVRQEGGTNESYDGVSGTSTLTYRGNSLKGYYNYYNIGAFEDEYTSSAVARGLAVAGGLISYGVENTPWNTREKAIMNGTKWISKNYISKGQDILYYQKFNVGPNAYYTKYTNQYMTNIIAPVSEALEAYDSYKSLNLLDTAYTFTIPVYNNMPTYSTAHPPVGDTNNNLNDIKINNTIVSGFDSDVLTYTKYIASDTTSVNISANASSSTATITGTGTISTPNATTTVSIKVSSQIGTTKTYTVTLIKSSTASTTELTPDQVISKASVRLSNGYVTGFQTGTTVGYLTSLLTKNAPNANVTINKTGTVATGNKITIVSNGTTKTYEIVIKGDTNGDGKVNSLDLLRVQKQILGYTNLSGSYKDACDVNFDGKVNSLDLLKVQKHILGYSSLY